MDEAPKASISVEIDKNLLLKFKSLCVLKEVTMSEEIEKMVRDWVSRNEGAAPSGTSAPGTGTDPSGSSPGHPGEEELSDEIEDQVEKDIKG